MSISFKWTTSTDNVAVSHYEVFRVGALGVYATVAASPAPQYTDIDTPAIPGSYTYYTIAVDTSGNHSIPSGQATFSTSTADTTPPTAPAGLSGTPSSSGPPDTFTLGTSTLNNTVLG